MVLGAPKWGMASVADFVDGLKQEITALEAQLQGDPRYLKLQSLRHVLSLYESGVDGKLSHPDLMLAKHHAEQSARTVTRTPSESRQKALDLAQEFLMGRTAPTPTREILEHIIENGGEIGGREPVSNLSAMLSNSDLFQSHGRVGWTLIQEGIAELSEESIDRVVESVLENFDDIRLKELNEALNDRRENVPPDIDRALLTTGRQVAGRMLTDQEARRLRKALGTELSFRLLI